MVEFEIKRRFSTLRGLEHSSYYYVTMNGADIGNMRSKIDAVRLAKSQAFDMGLDKEKVSITYQDLRYPAGVARLGIIEQL